MTRNRTELDAVEIIDWSWWHEGHGPYGLLAEEESVLQVAGQRLGQTKLATVEVGGDGGSSSVSPRPGLRHLSGNRKHSKFECGHIKEIETFKASFVINFPRQAKP